MPAAKGGVPCKTIMHELSTTIVAPATGHLLSAIAVIRLSGPDAIGIVNSLFDTKKKEINTRGIYYGNFRDSDGNNIDEVVVTIFPGPNSYTKQDTAEISCHGSPFIVQSIIEQVVKSGAVLADPGEFTYRSYINGRMDLAQAEAVGDLIASANKAQHEIALTQLKGGISEEIKDLRQRLIDFASLIELELDFGEEDVEFADQTQFIELVQEIQNRITQLIASFDLGSAIKEGIKVVIAGRPNAGKSTLMNALLKEERSIVSDIPGTTRDAIEARLVLDGLTYRLIDTAGIRETEDQIEKIGVARAMSQIDQSKIIVYIVDVSTTTENDLEVDLSKLAAFNKPTIVIFNKIDLESSINMEGFEKENFQFISISAKNKTNLEGIKSALLSITESEISGDHSIVISNIRHKEAFQNTHDALKRVLEGFDNEIPKDLVAMDVRQALYHLGCITGEISTDDLLANIFANFCIGK